MTFAKQITSIIAAGAIGLMMTVASSAQPATTNSTKKPHMASAKQPTILRIKHVGTKTVLVPTRRLARPTKVYAGPSTDTIPGGTPTVPSTAPGGSPDPRLLGTPSGVDGTGVPGPGTDH